MPAKPVLPPTQYRQRGHSLLADGRTAALLDVNGNISWLCWPRVDSDPVVLTILDRERGGWFQVRPVRPSTTPVEYRYLGPTLGVRTVWQSRTGGRLSVDDALAVPGPPRLLRLLRAVGEEIEVDVHFLPAFAAATLRPAWELAGGRVIASAGGLRLSVDTPARTWTVDEMGAHARFTVVPGPPTAVVLSGDEDPLPASAAVRLLDDTLVHWGAIAARMRPERAAEGLIGRVLGADAAVQLVVRSGLTICGLRQSAPGHGIVAAPTTSLPQFLGGALTWDYRYSWPRDTALAGMALTRLGLVEEATALGSFCGEVCRGGEAPALVRVDGTAPPPEITLEHLRGHDGARPVRIGNGAAGQAQLDVVGEVIDLAHTLERAGALPEALREAVPALAGLAVRRWREPDHGIWEIRGEPHCYTHSRVMAWAGLRRAAVLARRGAVTGDPDLWERTAERIRASVLDPIVQPRWGLPLIVGDAGDDAANALVPLVGFLPPDDPLTLATLHIISQGLGHGPGLVQRHSPIDDGTLTPPCAPFIFATFWLATAFDRCRGAKERRLAVHHARAALRERGPLGLFGEVSLPRNGPMGNYPQVQSHAALILAALPRGGPGGRLPGGGRV
jgi:GH15 family glucan-1,4-alpha-glucosidase